MEYLIYAALFGGGFFLGYLDGASRMAKYASKQLAPKIAKSFEAGVQYGYEQTVAQMGDSDDKEESITMGFSIPTTMVKKD